MNITPEGVPAQGAESSREATRPEPGLEKINNEQPAGVSDESPALGEKLLEDLRQAIQSHDAGALKRAAIEVQSRVDDAGPNKDIGEYGATDEPDYERCLDNEYGVIELWVGSGSHGQRIFIGRPYGNEYKLWMDPDSSGQRVRGNFARLFGIPLEKWKSCETDGTAIEVKIFP